MKYFSAMILFSLMVPFAVTAQNRVLDLDGHGDYVKLPPNIGAGLEEATIEGWFKWKGFQDYSQPIGFGKAWHAMVVSNFSSTADLQFYIYTSGDDLHRIKVPGILQLDRWYHIAGMTGREGMKLYFDGKRVGEHPFTGSFSAIPTDQINALGRSPWPMNKDFFGQLDEVRIWRVARAAAGSPPPSG